MNSDNREMLAEHLKSMYGNRVANYVIPGLDSYLLSNGTVRVFHSSRNHNERIVPHSHRYDFVCLVLSGTVWNRRFEVIPDSDVDAEVVNDPDTDRYALRRVFPMPVVTKGLGNYSVDEPWEDQHVWAKMVVDVYHPGEMYAMNHDEFHSIVFEKNTTVLFFQGPDVARHSAVLLPLIDGEAIDTFKAEPWMFRGA